MSTMNTPSSKLFKKDDLYVYDLGDKILQSLDLIAYDSNLNELSLDKTKATNAETGGPTKLTTHLTMEEIQKLDHRKISLHCQTCKLDFASSSEQRLHYQSIFHITNMKRKFKHLAPLTKSEFDTDQDNVTADDKKDEDEDENSSESEDANDSSETENVESETDTDTKEDFANLIHENDMKIEENVISHLSTQSAQLHFNSNLLVKNDSNNTNKIFAIYKSLFDPIGLQDPLKSIYNWNSLETQSKADISALFMVGGGHFAGAIVCHQRLNTKNNTRKENETFQEQAVLLIKHKTFHRYTTRRKQGGAQSIQDNSKGKAKSAGSTLRRYNEAALKTDIQNLLIEWKDYLVQCENIFIKANNVFDRRIFFENNLLRTSDIRVKNFPFTTGRPTIHELKRSWCELTYLRILDKPIPNKLKEKIVDNNNKSKQETKSEPEKKELTQEEKNTEELLQLLRKGKAPLLMSYLRKNKIDINFRLMPESKYATVPTLLHYASQQGLKQMIIILLSNMKADPTIKNSIGKTAWDLNKDISIKQAFQIGRYNLGEDFINWDESNIGEPLSREAVNEINEKAKELEDAQNKDLIQKELDNVKEQKKAELEAKRGPGHKLVNNPSSFTAEQNLNSLTPDQRRRIMREQRARAAEARMQARI